MAYPQILNRKIQYDIDGTLIGWGLGTPFVKNWVSSTVSINLNSENNGNNLWTGDGPAYVWFFFPELVQIDKMFIGGQSDYDQGLTLVSIEGSTDTGNGNDGTWEAATLPEGTPCFNAPNAYTWRTFIRTVSFSGPIKALRLKFLDGHGGGYDPIMRNIHIYGKKAAGETPDDIIFCDVNGNELTALKDWGDRPEGSTLIDTIYFKNVSATKSANNINLSINHADFRISLDQTSWYTSLDFVSLASGTISVPIYVKNTIGSHPQTLGPRAAELVAAIGSWI